MKNAALKYSARRPMNWHYRIKDNLVEIIVIYWNSKKKIQRIAKWSLYGKFFIALFTCPLFHRFHWLRWNSASKQWTVNTKHRTWTIMPKVFAVIGVVVIFWWPRDEQKKSEINVVVRSFLYGFSRFTRLSGKHVKSAYHVSLIFFVSLGIRTRTLGTWIF